MRNYVRFESSCDIIDIAYFDKIKPPEYRTIEVVRFDNIDIVNIKYKNENGQVINLARSVGTDKENVRGIRESIENRGWDVTTLPPFVCIDDLRAVDGFSRLEALLQAGQQKAPVTLFKIRSGYTIDDAIDELGLGLNDHPQSKKATIVDFKSRLISYFARLEEQGKQPSLNDGINWFRLIPQSFSDDRIKKAVEEVLDASNALKNMESLSKKTAQQKAAELLGKEEETVFAVSATKSRMRSSTPLKRLITDCLYYYDEHGKLPDIVGYTDKVSAQDSAAVRKTLELEIEKINRIMIALTSKYKKNPKFNFLNFKGHVPQMIGKETELVVRY